LLSLGDAISRAQWLERESKSATTKDECFTGVGKGLYLDIRWQGRSSVERVRRSSFSGSGASQKIFEKFIFSPSLSFAKAGFQRFPNGSWDFKNSICSAE
jgi:hypothetical protein